MKKGFAIMLPQVLPPELNVFLKSYLYVFHDQNFLICSECEAQYPFVSASIVRNDKSKKEWSVMIPTQYVLAVADMSDPQSLPIGFAP